LGGQASAEQIADVELLVIEDDVGDVLLVQRALLSEGLHDWSVTVASTLRRAKQLLSLKRYDLILLDANLPDATQPRTLDEVLLHAGETPVVMLTGANDPEEGREIVRRGAQDWMPKQDLQPPLLRRVLQHTLERQRLRLLERQMNQADKLSSLGKLAAGVAHEINNPAAFVLMNQEVGLGLVNDLRLKLRERPDCQELLSLLEELLTDNREGLTLIRSMVSDLSGFARMERDEAEQIELNALIQQVCNLASRTLRRRAKLTLSLVPLPPIIANRDRLTQLLLNLLTNAAHAVPADAPHSNHITIRTTFEDDVISIFVEDSGVGIHPRDLPHIFEPFFTTKPSGEGTGLGMTLVAETARQHRGHVEVESQLGEGTCIRVVIPRDTGLKEAPPAPAVRPYDPEPVRHLLRSISDKPLG